NGLLLPRLIPKLEGLDFILTSLDYPTAEMHDRFRGIKLFDKVIDAINLANKKNIKVIISTVVMKGNLGFLEDICELAENLDCSIELYPCEDILWNVSDQILKVENVQELIPNLSQWANKIRDLRTKFRNILTDPISLDIIENGGFGGTPYYQDILRCNVAKNYMFIRHDGFIEFPCKLHPAKRFNVLNHSFSEIYKSKEVRDIMKLHDDYDFCKGCRLGCAVVSSLPSSWYALYSKYVRGFFSGNLR
ncbi:MAG: SPASM domain-containing protein, partial [Promethearchaeota archaeon]